MGKRLVFVAGAAIAAIAVAAFGTVAADAASVTIDGKPVDGVVVKSGHLMVPFRAPLEALGASVAWDDATNVASSTYAGAPLLSVTIGSTDALVTGQSHALRVAPVLENHLAYIPVETLADVSHAKVDVAADGQSATVTGWDLQGLNDVGGGGSGIFLWLWVWILVVGGFAYIGASIMVAGMMRRSA
jgi:hypothetical protein